MKLSVRQIAVCVLAALLAAGCRKNDATGPSGLTGTWRGAIADSVAGAGSVTLVMSQNGAGVTGTWSATFTGGAPPTGGTLSGTVAAAQATLFLTPSAPTLCPAGSLNGTLSVTASLSTNRLSGTYVALTCTGTATGSIDVSR